jgi:hypothetical protein
MTAIIETEPLRLCEEVIWTEIVTQTATINSITSKMTMMNLLAGNPLANEKIEGFDFYQTLSLPPSPEQGMMVERYLNQRLEYANPLVVLKYLMSVGWKKGDTFSTPWKGEYFCANHYGNGVKFYFLPRPEKMATVLLARRI